MKKGLSIALAVVLLALTALTMVSAPVQAATDYTNIRVRLSSLGTPVSIQFMVSGEYSINGTSMLAANSRYTVSADSSGVLILSGGHLQNPQALGTSFSLVEHQSATANLVTIYGGSYGTIGYKGKMSFYRSGTGVMAVNTLELEEYLYGVVPFEMYNTWPQAALQAQAVAARSYASMHCGRTGDYDVVDTESSQVYKGAVVNGSNVKNANANATSAIDATRGRVLSLDNTTPLLAYFSSSNGGRMLTSGEGVGGANFASFVAKPDPYDTIYYPFTITKDWQTGRSRIPTALYDYVLAQLATQAGNMGPLMPSTMTDPATGRVYVRGTAPGDIWIYGAESVTPATKSSRGCYQSLDLVLKVDVRFNAQGVAGETPQDLMNISPKWHSMGNMTVSIPLTKLIELLCPGKTYRNILLYSQTDIEYEIRIGQTGHAVGLSQYGAKKMAEDGNTLQQILDFYYNTTPVITLSYTPKTLSAPPGVQPTPLDNPGTNYVPQQSSITTVQITDAGVVVYAGPGLGYGIVGALPMNAVTTLIGVSGDWYRIQFEQGTGYIEKSRAQIASQRPFVSLQVTATSAAVRSTPQMGSRDEQGLNRVLGTVSNGQTLTGIAKVGDWYEVYYGFGTGFIQASAVRVTSGSLDGGSVGTPPPTGTTPPPATTGTVVATVTPVPTPIPTTQGQGLQVQIIATSLNVRSGPSTDHAVIGSLANGQIITVLSVTGDWYQFNYGNTVGYINKQYTKVL